MLTLTILKSGLDSSCQRLGPRLPWTNYGRDKLWLVGWVVSPDWLSRKLEVCDFCQVCEAVSNMDQVE